MKIKAEIPSPKAEPSKRQYVIKFLNSSVEVSFGTLSLLNKPALCFYNMNSNEDDI